MNKISIIVSVYNEEGNLEHFRETAVPILIDLKKRTVPWDYELLYINDGSRDNSTAILDRFANEDKNCRVVHFSRNFGHEAAMIAGIDMADGELMICMDADLQNPPELIPEILSRYENGYDIILMARAANKDAGLIKKITSSCFYSLLNKLSTVKFERNVSDFFAVSKRAANILRTEYREKNRYLRGYVQCIGFPKTVIEYIAPERYSGESKYTIRALTHIALHTMNCFSVTPLRAGMMAGIISGLLMLASFIYYIVFYIMNGFGSGTALLCSIITLLFTLLFLLLGTIGEYLGILMFEVKNRPIYIVADRKNFTEEEHGKI